VTKQLTIREQQEQILGITDSLLIESLAVRDMLVKLTAAVESVQEKQAIHSRSIAELRSAIYTSQVQIEATVIRVNEVQTRVG